MRVGSTPTCCGPPPAPEIHADCKSTEELVRSWMASHWQALDAVAPSPVSDRDEGREFLDAMRALGYKYYVYTNRCFWSSQLRGYCGNAVFSRRPLAENAVG